MIMMLKLLLERIFTYGLPNYVQEINIPKGTKVFVGHVAPQDLFEHSSKLNEILWSSHKIGTLPGGGNQIFIPDVDSSWFGGIIK